MTVEPVCLHSSQSLLDLFVMSLRICVLQKWRNKCSVKRGKAIDNSPKKAIHQYQGGIMCLTVDVCSSPAGAASLFVLPLLLWQLADDNRWWALITSSQHKMNSYPAPSRGVFTVGERQAAEERDGEAVTEMLLCWVLSRALPPLSISLTHAHSRIQMHTHAHTRAHRQGP